MTRRLKAEFRQTPREVQYIKINPQLWGNNEDEIIDSIHPIVTSKRTRSPLYKYIQSEHNSLSIKEYASGLIRKDEINPAIDTLANRKSVGNDGVTAEIIKKNKERIIPHIEILFHNWEITQKCRGSG